MRISDWSSDVCSSDLWRLHNMLSILAFSGGAAIGGFAVGIPAVLEIRRINSRGWELYHIAENAVSELNLIKDKRSDATSRGNRTRYAKRRAADPVVLEMGRKAG